MTTIPAPTGRSATRTTAYRGVNGLVDVRLEAVDGGLVRPGTGYRPLTADQVADLVINRGAAGEDVRVLLDDGASHAAFFTELAGLLGRDVLITPAHARLSDRPAAGQGPGHAVPVDESGEPVDWLVVQPSGRATTLPGWFQLADGEVRPHTGVVTLPLPDGVVLATRSDFTARRAAAARLRPHGDPALATIGVTVRSGAFLVGDYHGGQQVHNGRSLAGVLADLPLYGAHARLWLAWPTDPTEREQLTGNLHALADATGATLWTPPPGGVVEVASEHADLVAYDESGRTTTWRPCPPRGAAETEQAAFTVDGRLFTVGSDPRLRDTPWQQAVPPPAPLPAIEAVQTPAPPPVVRPATVNRPADGRPSGLEWLPPDSPVNAHAFDLYVSSTASPKEAVTTGIPSPHLYLLGSLQPPAIDQLRPGENLLKLRIEPEGAVALADLAGRVPASMQHLVTASGVYLLPAGWLSHAWLSEARGLDGTGTPAEQPTADGTVVLRCSGARHGVNGLPAELQRWPQRRTTAYALVSQKARSLPAGWMVLHRRRPPAKPGHWLLRLRLPSRVALDVPGSAHLLEPLASVRSWWGRLHAARVELILPSRSYDRVMVVGTLTCTGRRWRRQRLRGTVSLRHLAVAAPKPAGQ
ncbi:hypothetical protein AB0M36_16815 [Actinoplanes sp. NPDC051346]|uniref:hypothetical protein n=1 Tax=Actinoplanes sp. NPDC051346 TaxID=3155048 RepID=UPI00343EDD41